MSNQHCSCEVTPQTRHMYNRVRVFQSARYPFRWTHGRGWDGSNHLHFRTSTWNQNKPETIVNCTAQTEKELEILFINNGHLVSFGFLLILLFPTEIYKLVILRPASYQDRERAYAQRMHTLFNVVRELKIFSCRQRGSSPPPPLPPWFITQNVIFLLPFCFYSATSYCYYLRQGQVTRRFVKQIRGS